MVLEKVVYTWIWDWILSTRDRIKLLPGWRTGSCLPGVGAGCYLDAATAGGLDPVHLGEQVIFRHLDGEEVLRAAHGDLIYSEL